MFTRLLHNYYRWISPSEKDYAWDGPSGPTIDTKNSLRASLVHDIFYQAIRNGVIPDSYRRLADKEFRLILKEDEMSFIRRWIWWVGVRIFGSKHIK